MKTNTKIGALLVAAVTVISFSSCAVRVRDRDHHPYRRGAQINAQPANNIAQTVSAYTTNTPLLTASANNKNTYPVTK